MKETMEIKEAAKPDYKKTKVGWLPVDWKALNLGSFMTFRNGVNAEKSSYGKGVKFINVMEIFNNTSISEKDIVGSVLVTDKKLEINAVLKGDILFNRTSEIPDEIGMSSVYVGEERVIFGGFVIRGRETKQELSDSFKEYCFQSSIVRKQIISKGQGAIRSNIGQKDLEKVILATPPIPEQRRIAAILSTWDKAINTLQNLIAKKQERKKGLMQVLLTGAVRLRSADGEQFDGEWEEVKLKNCTFGNGKYGINAGAVKYSEDLPTYLRISDIDESGNFISNDKVCVNNPDWEKFILEKGDIVFARTGNTTGKSYLYDPDDGQLVYAGFLIKYTTNPKILLAEYLSYFVQTNRYWNWVDVMSTRSGQPGINATEYSGMPLTIPEVREQQKIASVLSTADREIENLQNQLEKLQEQKKGLMQKLLTGEVRTSSASATKPDQKVDIDNY